MYTLRRWGLDPDSQSSSYFPGPFHLQNLFVSVVVESAAPLFPMALALPWWDFRVLFPSHCHPPSLRIPLDTGILIAHGPAKNCADGNKGCPALLKARAACQSQSCVMFCFFFRFEAQKKNSQVQYKWGTWPMTWWHWSERKIIIQRLKGVTRCT